jgi:hypothetical protein
MIKSLSTTLRSSRMLPRHRAWRNASSAEGENRAVFRLFSFANNAAKCCTSGAMSSRTLAERGNSDWNDAQAEVQVFPEAALSDLVFQIFVRRRDDADVHFDRARRAQPLDLALLQDAKNLGLGLGAHVADFVQEDRPAIGHLELADLLLGGPREGAALVAEEFRLDQLFRNRRAIDLNETFAGAQTGAMNRACDQFLADTALSQNEHRSRSWAPRA